MATLLFSTGHAAEAATPLPAAPTPAPTTLKTQPVTERPDRVSAALSARLQNSRVLVTAETTETTLTYVNPDGTITLEASSGPVRVKQGDAWTAIDTNLVAKDGVLKPKAALANVTFSAGGDGKPLAVLERSDKQSYALTWPTALPQPKVEGSKATYFDAAGPGADIVLTAVPSGFRHDIVLRERPTGPVEYKIPIETKGLKLSETERGGLKLSDGKGKTVAAAPEPIMYSGLEQPWHAESQLAGSIPNRGKIDAEVVADGDQQALVLKPDPVFLSNPDTHYPVTVDPTTTLPSATANTISMPCPNGREFNAPDAATVGITESVCPDNWSASVVERALIGFDTSSLVGQQITDARLDLVGNLSTCPTGQRLRVQRITAEWDPDSVFWSAQPAVTSDGEAISTPPAVCTTTSTPDNVPWSIPVTDIARAWAGGQAGRGLMLKITNEDKAASKFSWYFQDGTTAPPTLVVTYGSSPATGQLRAQPVAAVNNHVYTNTLTPTLVAGLSDPDGGLLRGEFEVEHDPAASGQGTGQVWSGAVDNITAGTDAKITIPAGKLADGWNLRWRARASDGQSVSAWSQWQTFIVDATTPKVTSIYCWDETKGGIDPNVWGPKPTEAHCGVYNDDSAPGPNSTEPDVTQLWWGLDDPTTSTKADGNWGWSSDGKGGVKSLSFDINPGPGWHTLYAKVRDRAHNSSTVATFSFGVNPGGLVTAPKQERTQRFVTLDAAAAPEWTGVTYEYTTDLSQDFSWETVPPTDVTAPGTSTPISSWPQTRTDTSKNFTSLAWDAAKTLRDAKARGPIRVRACLSSSSDPWECTPEATVALDQSAFGGSYATSDVGPGTVALQSGDYSITSTDASLFGITVGRTHTSLNPGAERADEQLAENKVFGPGWRAGFPSVPSSIADFSPTDADSPGSLQLVGPDGTTLSYIKDGTTFTGIGDAADGSNILTTDEELTVTEPTGGKTTYNRVDGNWVVARTETSATESAVTYYRDAQGRITRIVAPVPTGVTCGTTLVAGCRALSLSYASATTATGVASNWGDFKDQVKSVSFTAFDPESNAMKTTVLASYLYDSTGHLRQMTDPRTNLATVYYYTGEGRISQITPPGLAPWRLEYDTGGRLAHVQRESGDIDPTWALAYDVPTGGVSAPIDLTAAQTTRWGQASDLPAVGTGVFPATHVPSRGSDGAYKPTTADWEYSQLTYTDVNGRGVNTAGFGAGAWQVSSARFDDNGYTIWQLSAENRAQALQPTADTDPYVAGRADSAERANLLATTKGHDGGGNPTVGEQPTRPVVLSSGNVVSARLRTTFTYDEGKPQSGAAYNLLTTTKMAPVVLDGTSVTAEADVQTFKLGYDPLKTGDPSGWDLRLATTETTLVPGQADIVKRLRYDNAGRGLETRMPNSTGADAGTSSISYYTAAAHPTTAVCGNKPQWAGLQCLIKPVAQPSGVPLPVTTAAYGYYGQLVTRTETVGSIVRTTTTTFDTAGRMAKDKVTVTPASEGGVEIPETTYSYDPATGLKTQVSAGGAAVTTTYDTFGRVAGVTDADGNASTATYTLNGDPATFNDGKGLTTYTYDGTDAGGRSERRNLLTKVTTNNVGEFMAAYNADGQLIQHRYPNGLNATLRRDNEGATTRLTYAKGGASWASFEQAVDAFGKVSSVAAPGGRDQKFTYDAAERLTKVQDSSGGQCVTRVYSFDLNTNRTSRSTFPATTTGACSDTTGMVTETNTYDQADRITNSGYTYDAFGRTTTVPAAHVTGTGNLQIGYHSNDTVASLSQNGQTRTFALDPVGRIRSTTTTGGSQPGTVTNHYAKLNDSPAWITEPDGSWTRNIVAFGGLSAIQKSNGTSIIQLTNLNGDVIASADNSPTVAGFSGYFEYTEYGQAYERSQGNPARYGWSGGSRRSSEMLGGIILMGARLYNPTTGRFLQVDPVPGGSANAYEYCTADPINCSDLDGFKAKKKTPSWVAILSKNIASAGYCLSLGLRCSTVVNIIVQAYLRSGTSPVTPDSKTGGDGKKRHFLLMGAMYLLFGSRIAWDLATMHEWGEQGKDDSKTDMRVNHAAVNWVNGKSGWWKAGMVGLYYSDEQKFWAELEKGYREESAKGEF
ncbi:DNRLRE domain-containing protein [Nonomuraea sp. CA-143628]|uniref:DNRLRE domain-containing protein n=1 Tax=Nonomuraea sp. CA-143628 TaxID=3239997 RepID=UPI003D8AFDD8